MTSNSDQQSTVRQTFNQQICSKTSFKIHWQSITLQFCRHFVKTSVHGHLLIRMTFKFSGVCSVQRKYLEHQNETFYIFYCYFRELFRPDKKRRQYQCSFWLNKYSKLLEAIRFYFADGLIVHEDWKGSDQVWLDDRSHNQDSNQHYRSIWPINLLTWFKIVPISNSFAESWAVITKIIDD